MPLQETPGLRRAIVHQLRAVKVLESTVRKYPFYNPQPVDPDLARAKVNRAVHIHQKASQKLAELVTLNIAVYGNISLEMKI